MNVADARGPFRRVKETFLSADLVFCNLALKTSHRSTG
jgi:hypothetical protein